MSWSFPLFRVFGTQLRVHVTFFLIVAWIAIVGFSATGWMGALLGIAFTLTLFACVVAHEFGHVLTAKRFGVRTPDITLLPIGGVARMERMPSRPLHELIVAVMGPAVNVVIALAIFPFVEAPEIETQDQLMAFEQMESLNGFFFLLMTVNIFLVVFNLIPAFPMDGGRVFRAVLAMIMPYSRATSLAAGLGQVVAFGLGLLGLAMMHPILILIAFFVFIGAQQEAYATKMRDVIHGVPVMDAVMTRFRTLKHSHQLKKAEEMLLEGSQTEFPVVDDEEKLVGVLTRADLMRGLRQHGEAVPVGEVMSAMGESVESDESLEHALTRVRRQGGAGIAPVLDPKSGKLVGLLTPENIGELVMVRSALRERGSARGDASRLEPKQVSRSVMQGDLRSHK